MQGLQAGAHRLSNVQGGPCPAMAGEPPQLPQLLRAVCLADALGTCGFKEQATALGPRDGDLWFGPRSVAQGAGEP